MKLEKRVRKMKEKGLEKGKIGEALQGDRQLTPGGGGGYCSGEERFSFGTVNNSPRLSWTAFTAPFVCSDI